MFSAGADSTEFCVTSPSCVTLAIGTFSNSCADGFGQSTVPGRAMFGSAPCPTTPAHIRVPPVVEAVQGASMQQSMHSKSTHEGSRWMGVQGCSPHSTAQHENSHTVTAYTDILWQHIHTYCDSIYTACNARRLKRAMQPRCRRHACSSQCAACALGGVKMAGNAWECAAVRGICQHSMIARAWVL